MVFIYKDKYELVYITEQNSTINYFDLDNHLENGELQQFLEDQAHFVKASIKEMNSTDYFQIAIKQACDEAFVIYTSHFVSQPHKV